MLTFDLPADGAQLAHVRDVARRWADEQSVAEWPLTLVLTELVANAIAVSPPGAEVGIVLSVRDGRIEVEVSDRGPGFGDRSLDVGALELPPVDQPRGRGLYLVRQLCSSLSVAREGGATVVRASPASSTGTSGPSSADAPPLGHRA
jgi:anti-sigma regulatory factor (Ser/Thr protein kinase)